MKALIRLGANISLKDNDSRNVLHAAVIHGGDLDRILDEDACVSFLQKQWCCMSINRSERNCFTTGNNCPN